MTDVNPPSIGQDPWGADLNAYFAYLETLLGNLSTGITSLDARVDQLEAGATTLAARVSALENKPEYVFNSASWQFSNAAPPATGNQLRLNNAQAALATQIDIRNLDNEGADRSSWFQFLNSQSVIRIQDWNDSSQYYLYDVTGVATVGADNTTIPVVWHAGAGTVPNAKCGVGFVFTLESAP